MASQSKQKARELFPVISMKAYFLWPVSWWKKQGTDASEAGFRV